MERSFYTIFLSPGPVCMANIVAHIFVQIFLGGIFWRRGSFWGIFRWEGGSDLLYSVWQVVTAAPAICGRELQGIMSWANGCILTGHSVVFTDLYSYTPWINNIISTKQADIELH